MPSSDSMNKVTLQFFPDFSFIISSAKVSLVKGVPVIHQYIAEKIEDLPICGEC